ncbi:DNA cytosine methyltransferase [Roseomonas sp. USHLN139]|uniref:DNA cytosine methyltransferase n=1 Tax=Roseomonas sp. USHLN139 TaxID=3081298 RepID=UPI003B02D254
MRAPRRRAVPAGQWPLDAGITVVLFAGMGGACAGLEAAGCPVQVANNHDDVALAAHAALHPHTRHVRGDIFDVDPLQATGGRRVRVLWASPDCRDHSVAKGGAPRSARVRSLPWQVCRWVGKTRPEVVMMENVREIRGWGPLIAKRDAATGRVVKLDGTVAARGEHVPLRQQQLVRDPSREGRSFRAFVRHLRQLGGDYQDRDLCCADYGVPTTRRRWFGVVRFDGRPIAWPAPTHAPRAKAAGLGRKAWVPAADIIDWSIPCPSIFERTRPLAPATMRRIAAGFRRYVAENPRPFIIPVCHSSGAPRAHDGLEPLPTLTTARGGELAIVAPLLVQTGYGERPGQAPRSLDILDPLGTQVAGGAKHALVAAWMVQHNLGVVGHDAREPVSTLTTAGTQQQVGVAYLAHLRRNCAAIGAKGSIPTLTCGGGHVAVVAAFLQQYYSQGSVSQAADEPMATITTVARHAVVTVTIDGQTYAVVDIGMRMLTPEEAARAHELQLPKTIRLEGKERALTKREAMRLIGNSVPARMAQLLAEANIVHALSAAPARAREAA